MGIYIKGMEMPDKCIKCKLMRRCGKDDLDFVCMPANIYVEDLTNAYKPRPDWCPLFPVTDHGRLIEADELYDTLDGGYDLDFDEVPETKAELLAMIKRQVTIIPADKEGAG